MNNTYIVAVLLVYPLSLAFFAIWILYSNEIRADIKKGWLKLKAWLQNWKGPSKPIDTFFDDSPPKAMGASDFNTAVGGGIKALPGKAVSEEEKTQERLFWLEQEVRRLRTAADEIHEIKSSNLSVSGDVSKMDRAINSLGGELSEVIDRVERATQTITHLLKTKASEETFQEVKNEVARMRDSVTILTGKLVKWEETTIHYHLNAAKEVIRQRLDNQHSQHMNTVESILRRIEALEKTKPTDEARLFAFVKQSADIKTLAIHEVSQAMKDHALGLERAKDDLEERITKKLAVEIQEIINNNLKSGNWMDNPQLPEKLHAAFKKAVTKAKKLNSKAAKSKGPVKIVMTESLTGKASK